MPRYYFHLRDHSERILDPEGREIGDPDRLAEAAVAEARAIIAHDAHGGIINLDQRIEVEDEARNVVYTLHFADAVQIVPGK